MLLIVSFFFIISSHSISLGRALKGCEPFSCSSLHQNLIYLLHINLFPWSLCALSSIELYGLKTIIDTFEIFFTAVLLLLLTIQSYLIGCPKFSVLKHLYDLSFYYGAIRDPLLLKESMKYLYLPTMRL